uniref:glucuronosyltransferase n=1 Tax=Meloidogyne enterolobii TaxID=390850 RepID=A0A6V7WVK9_MELEN|nr:unnamed protein product [Meloidogyne enterolobii]
MAGSFAVFDVLGIKNTFDITNSVFFPGNLQFLEFYGNPIDFTRLAIPEYENTVPGLWTDGGLSSNYEAINQRVLTGLTKKYPEHDEIIYIGGILVEDKGILTNRQKTNPSQGEVKFILNRIVALRVASEQKLLSPKARKKDPPNFTPPRFWLRKPNCVVYVSFGTINIEGMDVYNLKIMLNNFTNYGHCFFKVRLGEEHHLKEDYLETNISFENFYNDQQEILAKENTKLFISHCGINSLTESIYAGVPLICIPDGGDQFYLSSLVEHKNIGIFVLSNQNFSEQFGNALEHIIGKRNINQNSYRRAVNKLRRNILDDFNNIENPWIKDIFIGKIEEFIGE